MKAFQLLAHGSPGKFEVRTIPDPIPRTGQVVVDVRACGLNHLDLWLEEGGLPIKCELPRTPGSEVAGLISQIGPVLSQAAPDKEPWQIGARVAVQSNLFCGRCEFCVKGQEAMCLTGRLLGVDSDGGFAEKVLVPASSLVRLPDTVSFETSAALTLAASTAMHMLTDRSQVNAGDWVLVIGGTSGVGSAAIQIAKELGARVISTGSTSEKRALSQQLGADFAVDSTHPAWPSEVRKLTGKRGVDLVVEHVGGEVLAQCFDCLARGGTVVTCGATAGRNVTLDIWPLFVKQQRLIGSYGRNRGDIRQTLDWAVHGKLSAVIHSTFPLERAGEAFMALRQRKILGKAIVLNAQSDP